MFKSNISLKEQNIFRTINQRRHQDIYLFDGPQTSYYWKLSDLAILYPNSFDTKTPISSGIITKINGTVFDFIPKFKNLTPQPIHIVNFKETYNTFVKGANEIKTVKNSLNQKLSPVVCEYLFGQIYGTEFEQACFICQDQQIEKAKEVSELIKFYNTRNQIKRSSETLASIIKHAVGSRIDSYSEIWRYLWCRLFDLKTMDDLREKYNVKDNETIMNYMQLNTLLYINSLLQEIIQKLYNRPNANKEEIKYIISMIISPARIAYFKMNYSNPETDYTKENTENTIIKQTQKARTEFWHKYYPISLQQK